MFSNFVSANAFQGLKSSIGIYGETNKSELAAFASYALAFPNNFLALVDTYDVGYLLNYTKCLSWISFFSITASIIINSKLLAINASTYKKDFLCSFSNY